MDSRQKQKASARTLRLFPALYDYYRNHQLTNYYGACSIHCDWSLQFSSLLMPSPSTASKPFFCKLLFCDTNFCADFTAIFIFHTRVTRFFVLFMSLSNEMISTPVIISRHSWMFDASFFFISIDETGFDVSCTWQGYKYLFRYYANSITLLTRDKKSIMQWENQTT